MRTHPEKLPFELKEYKGLIETLLFLSLTCSDGSPLQGQLMVLLVDLINLSLLSNKLIPVHCSKRPIGLRKPWMWYHNMSMASKVYFGIKNRLLSFAQ